MCLNIRVGLNVKIRAAFVKANKWLLVVPCFLGAVLVFATIDTTVYTTQELVIIPAEVTSDGWVGLESVLVQDVGEYALYQEFSSTNAAYPIVVSTTPVSEAAGNEESSVSEPNGSAENVEVPDEPLDGESVSDSDEPSPSESLEAAPVSQSETESISQEETESVTNETAAPEPPSAEVETAPEPAPEPASPEPVVWGVFPKSIGRFPHAQEISEVAVEEAGVAETVVEEQTIEESVVEPVPEEVVAEEEVVVEDADDSGTETEVVDSEESVSEEGDLVPAEAGEVGEGSVPEDGEGAVEADLLSGDEPSAEVDDINPDYPNPVEFEEVSLGEDIPETTLAPCDEGAGCKSYALTFTGFSLPEFDGYTVLDNAQLRLSLAAKQQKMSDYAGPQRFRVEYRYSSTSDYEIATVINVDDELSNGINGGYQLVSFVTPPSLAALANLDVRVVYDGNLEAMEAVYVESLWLEVKAGSFYEDATIASTTDEITYDRDLLDPKFHELQSPDLDATFSELPSFTLSYSPQQNFIQRVVTAILSDNEYELTSIRLTDPMGEVVSVPTKTIYQDDTTWTIQFLEQPQKLRSGKYKVELVVGENNSSYFDTFEFYWGVLAVNTTKSMYEPGERVRLQMAALTDRGDTICDAHLELLIIDPQNEVFEVPIEHSGKCGKNNITDVPDYEALFTNTTELGKYSVQLVHKNQSGEVVHKIHDSFEVREFVPLDIERSAPTRIYPLAPYKVSIDITANREYVGDVVERVPRGFVFEDTGGGEVVSRPDFTELVWRDVHLSEGERLSLSYEFDAPNISPYTYLLGPLDMDGFRELRHWQIASDALSGIGWFTATRTVGSANLNNAASPLEWSTSTFDTYYFDHATSSNSHIITFRQDGDYFLSVNLPIQRTDGTNSRSRVGVEVRLNGVAVPEGLGRSGYIRNANSHGESSSNAHFMLSGVQADDELTVYVEGLGTIEVTDIVNVSGKAGLFLAYVQPTSDVFAATTTRTTNSTNLNQTTAYPLQWTETRQDSGYVHSDSVNPENIVISNPGAYRVYVNVPVTSATNQNQGIIGRVLLNGVQVSGGVFAQGSTRLNQDTDNDQYGSLHWAGVVVSSTSNEVLTITTERDGNTGTTSVTSGFFGSIYVEPIAAEDTIVLRGRDLSGGTDWSDTPQESILWDTSLVYDTDAYTHSTSTNTDDIIVDTAGDYYLTVNAALTSATQHANVRITVEVNGVPVSGAQTKSFYNRGLNGLSESSGSLVFLLEGLSASSTINIFSEQEGANATMNDSTDAIVTLTKLLELNERPGAPTTFNTPFDNIRFASTTPYFDFQASDPDGTSNISYEFQIGTSSDFVGAITRYSSSSAGFTNTASSTDTAPFTEGETIRFQLQSADALTDLGTYYWRVRARDDTGSGDFGDWSVTQSLTVDLAVSVPSWYQTYNGQFEGDTLVGTISSGNDQIRVDATPSSEILAVYGEGTVTTPRYRLWNGTSWGVEGSAQAVTNTINWLASAAAISRDEYILVTLDQSNDAYAQVYSASTSSWGSLTLLSDVVSSNAYRGIAVGYESLSGDAMAVSCTNSPNPVYRIWNGSSWSATTSITASGVNNCNFLQIASDPASDEMILLMRDTGTQYEAFVWDGSGWVSNKVMGSSAKVAREGMAVAYESSGDQAMVTVSNGTANNVLYSTWNGVEWSANGTQAVSNDYEFGNIASDPDSDNLVLCFIDEDNDIMSMRWDGGVWTTDADLSTTGNADTGRPVDCEFETAAGRGGNIVAMYGDTGVDGDYHQVFSTTTGTWSGALSGSDINDAFWVQSERAGDGTIVALHLDDENDRIDATYWNGSTWSTRETLEANPSSQIAIPYEVMTMSAKRFQFVEGVATTPPIDFTAVPNQPTWGDINFSTTEPFGTDVQVRVRYTATTTCDAYIPDGALPGNSGGFDVTDSPIDLTSLSTSTYDQICLEATITTQGSESASLDEWTLSWQREPKLVQSNYRWYVNGSFLTPTDPWPEGVSDLAENTALDSTVAINLAETIRLRLALKGANVELPQGDETFKLQYAEGFTCSTALSWHDVGDPASTTALFRGYENAVIGDDWYDENWPRRIKITVNQAVVEEGVTDFPVYLDLSTLPSGFFGAVQSDGDDIRITEGDGITELPYELVAIDTGLETGELHFRADLASTTDTDFYVYYGNSGASGYAASATYGAQNVWTNGYVMRHALDDNPTLASPQFKDSTSNSNDAVARAGMTSGDVVAGQIGSAIDLDGNDGGVFETPLAFSGVFTASMWWNSSGDGFAIAGPAGANEKMGPWSSPANRMFVRTISSSDTAVANPTDGTWAYIAITRDSSNKVDLHINGTTTRLYSDAAQSGTSDWENFGGETSQGFRGILDELRFSNVRRSNGWLRTEYNNQSNPSGFYAVSAEELISDGRLLPSTLLTSSDYAETYEEQNPTRENQNALPVDDEAEWDFVIENHAAAANTNYCFRMVYEDGSLFNTYSAYPRLITNAPPEAPVLEAPFDNEQLASTTPWFEFAADDALQDLISYEIEVDDDPNFGSPVIANNSNDSFSLFTNINEPSERSQYTSGQIVRFISPTALANGTTYWWRVRGTDDFGSGTAGEWSQSQSFTVDTTTTITTWYQTTGDQFATDNLLDAVVSTSTNDVGIESGFTLATITSTAIDFDDRDTGNAWGELSWTDNETSGTIDYYVEYLAAGDTYLPVPDTDLPGNSSGFNTSPVSLVDLNTTTYNELRIVAVLSGNSTLPRLQLWRVTWSETIEIPTLLAPFDNAKVATTTPSFTFFTTDPEGDDLEYEFQYSSSYDFAASSTFLSNTDSGFVNTESVDTSPFISGDIIRYTMQSALTNGNTYWWRVRARDPGGSGAWSDYSTPQSFTVDTAITSSVWYQTTGEQFATDDVNDIETTAGAAQITSTISEIMTAYGEGTGQAPRYNIWNGSSWGTAGTAGSVNAQVRISRLKASPTRPEYALGTTGTDNDVNVQIYDTQTDSWGDTNELYDNVVDPEKRAFDIAYETTSGDLLAVSCAGTNAVYSVWNGSSWSATSSISLANSYNCEWVAMASDPTSDEIIAVFRHTNTDTTANFEAQVWNGSSWGNSWTFGRLVENASEGMAIAYEESGDQAVLVVSSTTSTVASALYFNTWNGSSWGTASSSNLGDHIEFATLKSDVGTDRLALCYVDNDNNAGIKIWDGAGWGTFTEMGGGALTNGKTARAIDCEFETATARDGDVVIVYSDGTTVYYDVYTSSLAGQAQVSTLTDSSEIEMVRAGNDVLHMTAYDDALNPDNINTSNWSGSWATAQAITTNSSLNGNAPYIGGSSIAAQLYPNFVSGSVRSTAINFDDGDGPRWEEFGWSDTTPGASYIEYRLYYLASSSAYTLVPDSALSGNAAGFTSGPIDISALDRTVYDSLKLDAQLICVAGDCPVLNDWYVAWSEGITVSGRAYEFDGVSTTTSGTVAVAVNGALQVGKTGTIQPDGTWSVSNVTAFEGDGITVFVDGAADSDESVAMTVYDGIGDATNLELSKRRITFGSSDTATITTAVFAGYDNADDEDLFFTIDGSNQLVFCVEAVCADGLTKVRSGTIYQPGANITVHDFTNYGTFRPASSTVRVSGSWSQQGTFTEDTSTILFTATSGSETVTATGTPISFYNLTFGEASSTAVFTINKTLDVNNNLAITHGTLARGTTTMTVAGNVSIGAGGDISGTATTTFDGSGSYTWSDQKATSSRLGYVVIDGTAKTVTLAGNVGADTITIGADDTLNSSGSSYGITVYGSWTNNNSFIPQSGTVTFAGTSSAVIARGSSAFNNLTFSGAGGSWSFSTTTLTLNGSLTIATGTVTLPTGTTTIGGSFVNSGGTFLHNNGEVRMTSTASGRSITQGATVFNNAFYDLVFTGSGGWSFTESAATTSRNFRITAGTVTFPTGTLTIGGDMLVSGSGAFSHNNGEVVLLVQDSNSVTANSSSFNNLRTRGAASGSWYNDAWDYRLPIVVDADQIDATLTNFPVLVDLDDLPSGFWSGVQSDGDDIRVTQSDGITEVPIELVSISTGTTDGELYFRATSLSSTTDTTYYLYYGNANANGYAVTDTYGDRNVWSNGYVLVAHLDDLTASTTLNSKGTVDGVKTNSSGVAVTTSPLEVATGQVYEAQNFDTIPIQHTGSFIDGQSQYNVSMWFNPDAIAGAAPQETNLYGYSLFGVSTGGNYNWTSIGGSTAGTSANGSEMCVRAFTTATACNVTSGANLSAGNWYFLSLNAVQNSTVTARINGVTRGSFTAGNTAPQTTFTIGGLRPNRSPAIAFDGRIDEVRVSTTTRTDAWRDAEYRNMATTTTFYSAGAVESARARTFASTNMTVLGNLVFESGGDALLPTGVLSVGGSFDNDATFDARGGTVRFNSAAGAETIAAGTTSSFATLEFNSATGDFTVTESATATVAINLTSASQFTLQSGRTLAALGTFTHTASGSSTTWTGSTLLLGSGGTVTLNSKTHAGDVYGTLSAASSTLVKMWNSSATSYVTTGTTSAIYSQDHNALDGDLYIYGNYTRSSGTEYWSYATDFDGVALGTSTARQVDVRIASSSLVTIGTSTLSLVGSASASTTIDAISGAYDLLLAGATTTAQHFTFAGMSTNGVRLTASTTLSTFTDGAFTVTPSRTGISLDGATVNRNASGQFYRINFATTSAGAATNVTLTSSSSNFVWFRTGSGNLYGEAYDAGDGNPGSVRFDDSSNVIAVSGVVYSDDGTTPMGTAVCNGTSQNVRIVVDGGTYASSTSCASGTGAYSFPNVAFSGDPKVVVFLDLASTTLQAAVFSKTLTANVTDMDVYGNRLIVRHEDTAALTISDLATYDNDNEGDLPYLAVTSPTSSLTLFANTELFVWKGKTFAPGGNVTLSGNANSNGYEGTLQLGANSQFTATGTETHTLAGRLVIGSHASFTPASSTVVFNATTSGKSITGTSTIAFNNLRFAGTAGSWNLGTNLVVYGNMEVASGTVTGTGSITLPWGSLTGDGVLSLGSGTVTVARTNTLGGTTAWTFNNLTLGNGATAGTTTPGGTATTTILGALTISSAHVLDANASRWDLAGTGTVLVETGTFLEDTSLVRYSGAGANVTSTTYYDLMLNAGLAAPTYTAVGSGLVTLNNLYVGGATSTTFTLNTNDPTLEVRGSVIISSNGTLQGSNSALLTVLGSWDNDGTFVGNGGTVLFSGTGATTIAAGASSFSNVTINGTGSFTLTEPATTTGSLSLTNHTAFTVSSGQALAVGGQFTNGLGGAFTTWSGSTLYLYGGNTYEINASTTNDSYETLSVAAGTQVRMWNSSATSYSIDSAGSLYSMDHAGADGDLYIYGRLIRTSGSDFWSYGRDFDGTNLGTGRAARVYFASGASATWTSGNLTVVGTTSASTTLQNQGSGTYSLMISGTASTSWDRAVIRDTDSNGLVFSGTPTVVDFSRTDHLVKINSATAVTVGGTVINQNPSKNFTNSVFEADIGVTGAVNVTATGTAVAAWRFTNHTGDIAGEGYDVDPDGDPGYLVWDDSAALITIAGAVYSDEGITASAACDGSTSNIRLVVAGLTTYNATCTPATGAYSIANVAYNTNDTLVLYINDEAEKATTVTIDPISSIANLYLYENRVIVRHEGTDPITIDDMVVWDSSDDADIQYTALSGSPDTLTLPADRKLLVWNSKTFAPGGNVSVVGGGGGSAYDGTLEVQDNATYRTSGTETHTVGGSLIFGSGAVLTPAQSTFVLTTSGAARTIDVNNQSFHSLSLTGSGSWTVTDSTLSLGGSFTQSAGALTFPTGTTTVAGAFNATGGSFTINGSPLVFTATSTGNTVRFDDSPVASLTFSGVGGEWNMTDTNATATGAVIKTAGTLSLPSGSLSVGGNFENRGGTVTHNTSDLIMTSGTTATITASSSDLFALRITGSGAFQISDPNITFLDDVVVGAGSLTVGTGTLSVGGSFSATGGIFTQASGTVLLNAGSTGKTVDPGSNSFYNLQISAPSGGYTFSSATTTKNFTISSVNSFTLTSGQTLRVGGVFTNAVGGAATTWTGSTLMLQSGTAYSINSRAQSGDVYGTLDVRSGTDVRTWYSSAATTTVAADSSVYSQDNNNVNGHLYIYGDFAIATTTEYWNYATDFDGTSLTGSERKVSVYIASGATTTMTSGALQLLGASGNVTAVQNLTSSTSYAMIVSGGTLNANYYSFTGLGTGGLQLSGTPTITDLSNGYFALTADTEPLITLSSTTLNANPSKVFTTVGFDTTGILTGYSVELVGETTNAWRFSSSYGNLDGEGFDIDGVDACGSIRWDDSSCLLTSQTHVRWRYDDGGEGAPDSEWYNTGWSYRKRVRFVNEDTGSSATTALKMSVTYDSDMQSDFDDLRFTDADGTTLLSHWVEKYTPSVSAQVWVEVPSVAAADTTTVFMYYGSSTVSSVSSGTSTFTAFDDFEDNSISEYSGDTSLFQTDTSPVYGGTYALEAANQSGRTTDGIYRTDVTVSQGDVVRWMQYVSTANPADEGCTLFGVQSPGSNNQNYAVCLELLGVDRISLAKNVSDNDVSGTVLATTTVTYSTGWYEVEVDWQTDNSIDVYLYNSAGTLVATTSATDSSYTSGGIGFTFWFQKGAWDSYTSRTRGAGRPTVYFGSEQVRGGANWSSALDAAGNDYQPGDVARLRVAIENSGLAITSQEFELEYAAKASAPTCESVAEVDYATVPNQASCGSSAICMATSSYVTDGDPSTDQLFGTEGTFVAGDVVGSPSSKAAAMDISQDYYTELEYVLTPTINAADAYCFRVTNAGTALDYYAIVAELSLQYDPVVAEGTLNGGENISLTPGTTTVVVATTSVVDGNGVSDLAHATATFYRSALGASCTEDNNNCYRASTESGQCSFTGCSGISCTLQCTADVYFHADPTDFGTYEGQEWFVFFEAEDQGGGYGFNSSLGVEMQTLRGITVDSLINYGALEASDDTGSTNATTTVANLGNVEVDVEIEGTDLSDGYSSTIPATQQKFSTSTFSYSGCVSCLNLSSSTPAAAGLTLTKPANITPPVEADVYWGIAVPLGSNAAPHTGTNVFTPVSP